jgi:hypothetical protein
LRPPPRSTPLRLVLLLRIRIQYIDIRHLLHCPMLLLHQLHLVLPPSSRVPVLLKFRMMDDQRLIPSPAIRYYTTTRFLSSPLVTNATNAPTLATSTTTPRTRAKSAGQNMQNHTAGPLPMLPSLPPPLLRFRIRVGRRSSGRFLNLLRPGQQVRRRTRRMGPTDIRDCRGIEPCLLPWVLDSDLGEGWG